MRISDWSSDVCSSDLDRQAAGDGWMNMMVTRRALLGGMALGGAAAFLPGPALAFRADGATLYPATNAFIKGFVDRRELAGALACIGRSEEHTSELQSLMRISYAVFCLKKKIQTPIQR